MKSFPQIIQEVGFDFHWSNKKVWALNEPITKMDINELIWMFDIPFWEKDETDDYNFKPWEVINKSGGHEEHLRRVMEADLSHPIDIMENKGKWLILDGLHRLVKLYLRGDKKVKVRIIPRSRITEILKDE